MSYIHEKVACKGDCGLLFDADLLNEEGECHDCKIDRSFMEELYEVELAENSMFDEPFYYEDDHHPPLGYGY